jgi:hypothetical protein
MFSILLHWDGLGLLSYLLVVQAKKQVTDGSKQAEGYKGQNENSVGHVS